jgi:hypothetical protein
MASPTQPSERLALLGTIDPQTVINTQVYTDVIDLSLFHEALGICLLGNMASETIDFKAYYCDSDGNNAVALKSATQLAASATANDNKQILINIKTEDLQSVSKRYVKFGLVTGSNTGGPAAVLALGLLPRYGPGNSSNLNTVVEIKS